MEGKAWTPTATEHIFDLFPAISFFSQLQTFFYNLRKEHHPQGTEASTHKLVKDIPCTNNNKFYNICDSSLNLATVLESQILNLREKLYYNY